MVRRVTATVILLIAHCFTYLLAQDATPPDSGRAIQDRTCLLMLESFANLTASYTYCTISHARPITLCQQCVSPYLSVMNVYEDITKIDSEEGKKCASELANLDRLQVFESGYNYVRDLWRRANCDSCFVTDPKTGNPTVGLTPFVQKVLNASAIYEDCVTKYHNASIKPDLETCDLCSYSYQEINTLYNGYKAKTGGIDFCMDIVDLINNTRNGWSDDIGCTKTRRQPELTFLLSSLGIGFLPVVFYLMIYAFTKKKEHPLIERKRTNND
ncbi:Osteopetrosis-associated transmembrane protein 1 precursor [Nesidiocoris tenuis]|uniref:Osteopetrosis-associated transmembrane protein 1 n=1 Tax=Nesidiocoris tenuis TaxID=355587 RepID=A0ABN7B5F8_9HEMI|nr:Osteopetrosis-associated transmembrane protein 1 precursor [Nesidiocoris tenuis]